MSNDYYNPSGTPATGAFAASAAMRTEFDSIAAGFNKLPTLTANKAVIVNSAGTALTVTGGSLALAGDVSIGAALTTTAAVSIIGAFTTEASFTMSGAHAFTGTLVGPTSVTFPTSGTLATTVTPAAAIVVGTTAVTGGTNGRILAVSGSNLGEFTTTGTGTVVALSTSPTLTTPTLGVATATSINKVAITAPASNATLTIANGKTLTANATLTLAGADATVMTFPSASTTLAGLGVANVFSQANTFQNSTTTLGVQQTTRGSLVLANTAAGSYATTIQSANDASEAWTLTLPPTKGAAGQFLSTNGSGVTDWINGTAGLVQVGATQVASNSATIDFTSLPTTYNTLIVVATGVQPAAADSFNLRIGTGSTTWQTADYQWVAIRADNSHTTVNASNQAATAAYIRLSGGGYSIDSASGGLLVLKIANNASGSLKKAISWEYTAKEVGGDLFHITGGGQWDGATTAITGLRFLFESQNISVGSFTLYAMSE